MSDISGMISFDNIEEVDKEQFMTFTCDNEVYGVFLKYVNEKIGLQQITNITQ